MNGGELDVDVVLHAIGVLFEEGDVIEIRALNVDKAPERGGSTYAGYFEFGSSAAIEKAIQRLDGRSDGIYVVLNRFNPDLLSRAKNRLQVRPKNTTTDNDIIERRWLYIDADPERAPGISSTDEEHDAAVRRIGEVRAYLNTKGWPDPVVADSGNGAHLLYRLPPMELAESGVLVKQCLKALHRRFSDAAVTIDESTANASRICKLYGTLTRKGDPAPGRPHRRAKILDEPETVIVVPIEALRTLAAEVSAPLPLPLRDQTGAKLFGVFRIDDWITSNMMELIKGPEAYNGGRRWTLAKCPFNPEHAKPVIIELSNGALSYKCLHKSCGDNDWKALRQLIKPEYADRNPARLKEGAPADIPDALTRQITDLSQVPNIWTFESNLQWIVKEIIAQGSVTLISAESGTGKTWLAYYIAGCIAHGRPIIGRDVKQSKVLYLDGENPAYTVKQRLFDLGIPETPNLTVWGGWAITPPPGPADPLVAKFAQEEKGVIIYDSLIEFHPGSEQSSTETRAFMRYFRQLANFGATVIILHHSGKAETSKLYRGSSDIKAAVDTAYQLRATDEKSNKLGRLQMNCFKGRLMPAQSFGLEFRPKEGFVPCEHGELVKTTEEKLWEIIEANPGRNQKYLVAEARKQGCSKRQVEDSLKAGPWDKEKGSNNSTLYSLP